MEEYQSRIDLSAFSQKVSEIKTEIGKFIVGQEHMTDLLIIALLSDGHVLLEGVPGVAKTLMARVLARTIDTTFKRIQFTPDLLPSDIIGTTIFNMQKSVFSFHKGPLFSNVVLVDEINRAPAKTQAALFEAMEERQISVDGTTYPLLPPFVVLATQNPIDLEGTYRLPEAQIDRFLFKIVVDYPKIEEEKKILNNFQERKGNVDIGKVNKIITSEELFEIREKVSGIYVEEKLIDYIAKIVDKTRNNPDLYLGSSPRGSLSILASAKACAAINGRDFVTPDDIKYVTPSVLIHRLILSPEKDIEGVKSEDVISDILSSLEIPR